MAGYVSQNPEFYSFIRVVDSEMTSEMSPLIDLDDLSSPTAVGMADQSGQALTDLSLLIRVGALLGA